MIADERRGLADLLETLDEAQWDTPSLCEGWSVRTVAGHLTVGWNISIPRFAFAMVRHRGFDRANDHLSRDLGARSGAEIVADLREHAEERFTPPGFGPEAPLTDLLVHGLDMRRPLGIARELPADRAAIVLGMLTSKKGAKAVGPKGGLAELCFRATDGDWTWGDGAEVNGTTEALLLSLSGRTVALAELGGDGAGTFRQRWA